MKTFSKNINFSFHFCRKHLLDPAPEEDHIPPPEFRPGGFNWGGNGAEAPPEDNRND